MSKANEVYEATTRRFVAALEESLDQGRWVMPWRQVGAPRNVTTGNAYKGGNVVTLLFAQIDHEWPSSWWATYKQWQSVEAQVRKGERSTLCVKWVVKEDRKDPDRSRMVPFTFSLFNAAQVDGWEPEPVTDAPDPIVAAHDWFARLPSTTVFGADQAAYALGRDVIMMPALEQFIRAESFYATWAHEHVHWTGAAKRLARPGLGAPHNSDDYASEELVAELGSAFVCNLLGIESVARDDHLPYLASWIRVLRGDASRLFKASTAASKAVDYLLAQADQEEVSDAGCVGSGVA